jgi:hypothetical protein
MGVAGLCGWAPGNGERRDQERGIGSAIAA